jgi:undecaprenyl-diphosphatase
MRSPSRNPFALAVIGVMVVVGLATAVGAGVTDPFDAAVIEVVRADALHDLLSPLRWVTELGSTAAVTVLAAAALIIGIMLDERRNGVIGALTILAASIGNSLLKLTVARARPDLLDPIVQEHGFSFPSGHSALGMVAYGVLAVIVARSALPHAARFGILAGLGVLVGLIGMSRVWLGVHYPTDVLAGWTAGAVIVVVYAAITRRGPTAPAGEAAGGDRAAPRSDRPVAG